jgi:hypothetical protein
MPFRWNPLAWEVVSGAMHVCELVLGYGGESDDRSSRRTAVHEAGHALCALVEGLDFTSVEIGADGGGVFSKDGVVASLPGSSHETRMAVDVAGAIAEELSFGDVEPLGIETDLRMALARAYILDPNATDADGKKYVLDPDCEELGWVRREVRRVRRMFSRRKRALDVLAETLLASGSLSRVECARIVRDTGSRVGVRARFSPTVGDDELFDCECVAEEIMLARAKAAAPERAV